MRFSAVAVATAALLLAAQSARACVIYTDIPLEESLEADVVVIGYVTDFEPSRRSEAPFLKRVVQNWIGQKDNEKYLIPTARVTLRVAETLSGSVPTTITADWQSGINNGPPDEMRGAYLIALRANEASRLPDGSTYSVVSDACSGALVFRRGSHEANSVRALFGLQSEPLELPPRTLAETLGYRAVPWPTLVAYGFLALSVILIGSIAIWPRRRANVLGSDADKPSENEESAS